MPDNILQTGAVFEGAQFKEGMREAAETVTESCTVMKEQFVQVGEAAQSMSAGFAGIAALAGAGVFGEIVNRLKETTLETSHLSEATGISVVHLTELKDAMAAAGVNADRLPMQLTKLSRAMQEAADGQQKMVTAFNRLGISTQGWTEKLPDAMEVLEQMAKHLANSTTQQRDLAEMSAILGRGTVGLTAFLKDLGVEFDSVTGKYVDHGKAVDSAVQAAKELQQQETQLKLAIDEGLLPTLGALNETIKAVRIGYELTAMGVRAFLEIVVSSFEVTMNSIRGTMTVLESALAGKFKLAGLQAGVVFDQMGSAFDRMSARMNADASVTAQKIAEIMNPKVAKEGKIGPSDDLEKKLNKLQEKMDSWYLHTRAIGIKVEQELEKESLKGSEFNMATWEKENREKIKLDDEKLRGFDEEIKGEIESARQALQIKTQLIDNEFLKGKINKQQEIAALAKAKQDELQIELLAQQKRFAIWEGDPKKVQQIENEIKKIMAQSEIEQAKTENAQLQNRIKLFKSVTDGMAGMFQTFTQGILTGNQTIGQSFAKMADDMAMRFINSLERQLMQFLIHLAIKDAADSAQSAKNSIRNAKEAAGNTYRWASGLVGPVIAGVLAAGAFVAVESFGSAEGGQYMVPGPQMTMLHPQEMVLPAGIAGRMRDVIDGGGSGGGHTVNVHMNVSAIDSASFKDTLGKHGHMIGEAVNRALRKKGIK